MSLLLLMDDDDGPVLPDLHGFRSHSQGVTGPKGTPGPIRRPSGGSGPIRRPGGSGTIFLILLGLAALLLT